MEQIKIENLTFSYPLATQVALENINITINSGEYILLCGKSGCGKTTFLRQFKNSLAPKGDKSGVVYFNKKTLMISVFKNLLKKLVLLCKTLIIRL